jgi:hypothetical protein
MQSWPEKSRRSPARPRRLSPRRERHLPAHRVPRLRRRKPRQSLQPSRRDRLAFHLRAPSSHAARLRLRLRPLRPSRPHRTRHRLPASSSLAHPLRRPTRCRRRRHRRSPRPLRSSRRRHRSSHRAKRRGRMRFEGHQGRGRSCSPPMQGHQTTEKDWLALPCSISAETRHWTRPSQRQNQPWPPGCQGVSAQAMARPKMMYGIARCIARKPHSDPEPAATLYCEKSVEKIAKAPRRQGSLRFHSNVLSRWDLQDASPTPLLLLGVLAISTDLEGTATSRSRRDGPVAHHP